MMGQRAPELQGLRGTCVHFRELCLAAASPKTDGVLERKTAKETALRPASSAWLEPGTNVTHTETAQQLRDPKNYGCRAEAHEGRGWRGPHGRPGQTHWPASPSALPVVPVRVCRPVHTALPVPSVPGAPYQILRLHKPSHSGDKLTTFPLSSPSLPAKDKEAEGGRSVFHYLFTPLKGRAACLKKDDGGFPVTEKYCLTTEISCPVWSLPTGSLNLDGCSVSTVQLVWDILYLIRQSGPGEKGKQNRPQLLPKRRTAKTLPSGRRGQNPLGACQQMKGLQEAG